LKRGSGKMLAPIDSRPIVEKLFEKTAAGRISWEGYGRRFTCTLEQEYTFEISKSDDAFALVMKDAGGNEIISEYQQEEIIFHDHARAELFDTLKELFELARRKALGVEEKVSGAVKLLDKI
jgi:hypothetical protein